MSTFTGLPTVLGWGGHVIQWGHRLGSRGSDVQQIYRTRDLAVARRLLARYEVRYVFVGSLERRDYPAAGLAKFSRLGRRLYSRGGTAVYLLPQRRVGQAAPARMDRRTPLVYAQPG